MPTLLLTHAGVVLRPEITEVLDSLPLLSNAGVATLNSCLASIDNWSSFCGTSFKPMRSTIFTEISRLPPPPWIIQLMDNTYHRRCIALRMDGQLIDGGLSPDKFLAFDLIKPAMRQRDRQRLLAALLPSTNPNDLVHRPVTLEVADFEALKLAFAASERQNCDGMMIRDTQGYYTYASSLSVQRIMKGFKFNETPSTN